MQLLEELKKPFQNLDGDQLDLDSRGRQFEDALAANPKHRPVNPPQLKMPRAPRGQMTLFRRILSPTWSEALANGEKWVEAQRYRSKPTNQLSFAAAQKLLVFGPSGQSFGEVHGVAVLASSAVRNQLPAAGSAYLKMMASHLHQPFLEYLKDCFTFDSVAILRVYDLRPFAWTWSILADRLHTHMPKQTQGFPGVGDAAVGEALLQLIASARVHQRPPSADSDQ